MELVPGMAFRCMSPPRHIHIPLFRSDEEQLILVNFTTLRESCIDDVCILNRDDYDELTHASTVAYSKAIIGKKTSFMQAIQVGHFIPLTNLPSAALRKIIEGSHQSEELSTAKRRLLPPI